MTNSFSVTHYACNGEICGHTKFALNDAGNYVLENYIDSGNNDLTLVGVIDPYKIKELYRFLGETLGQECEA